MFSTSTLLLQTGIAPRWIAFLGYFLGAMLLLTIEMLLWIPVVFPVWIFLISMAILLETPSRLQFQS